ncbi:MAG: hypothetical protein MJY98_00665 [Fibrobacter sp.]|nr:hypothetical protein [Fibrobacter sp.]
MGHIFFISPSSPGSLDKLSQWTFRWLVERGGLNEDTTLYTCNTIEDATSLLETALIIGESPALIVLDHADRPKAENLKFSRQLHDGIPESWIIELIPDTMPLPDKDCDENGFFWMTKPVSEEQWHKVLNEVLLQNGSPQWANNNN